MSTWWGGSVDDGGDNGDGDAGSGELIDASVANPESTVGVGQEWKGASDGGGGNEHGSGVGGG